MKVPEVVTVALLAESSVSGKPLNHPSVSASFSLKRKLIITSVDAVGQLEVKSQVHNVS